MRCQYYKQLGSVAGEYECRCTCNGDIPDAPALNDVREELPQYGHGVIAYCQFQSDEQYELDIVYLELNDKWISTKIGCEVDVLYWLPLPAPPDTKEG